MAGGRFFELSEERLELLRARRRAEGLEAGEDAIPRRPAGESPPPSFSQERLWFLDRLAGGDAHLAIPAPLLLTGTLDRRALARALADVVARHEPLRSTFTEPSGETPSDDRPPDRPPPDQRPPDQPPPDKPQSDQPQSAGPQSGKTAAAVRGNVRVEVTPPAEAFRRHLRLPGADLTALPPARRLPETERLVGRVAATPFDLARGPLLAGLLVDLGTEAAGGEGPRVHALLLAVHHVAADGWSLGVLFGDLARAYDAHRRGGPAGAETAAPTLTEPPVRYGDWAAWQRRRLSGERLAGEVDWWRDHLAGAPRVLDLPADRPSTPGEGFRGGTVRGALAPALADRLRALGRGLPAGEASPFMTLLALLALLLARWSGDDDLVIGTPVAGRTRRETEGLVGLFLNHLALRVGVDREAGFRDLLAAARDTALGAFAHQEVPFERLLEELEVPRDLATTPLFQVFLNLLSFPPPAPFGGGELEVSALAPARAPARFDLTLYADDRGPGGPVRLTLVYDARRFAAARMEEAVRQLTALAEQVVAEPDRPLATLSLVTAAARRALPDPGRRQDRSWPGPVHAAVDRHGLERPAAVAVLGPGGEPGGEAVTYRRLAAASRALAAELRRRGVGRGAVVAVHANREAALVAAVLAIHRAGAAFLLLDPAYPPARNALCCGLAGPAVLLDLDGAPAVPGEVREVVGEGRVLELGRLREREGWEAGDWVSEAASADLPEIGPDDLAYVAFTSGSTGEPKGVLGLHRSLTHFLPWQEEAFSLGPGDRFSLLSGLAHDPLHRDLFTPLWVGGSVAIPEEVRFGEPGYLAAWAARVGVTVIHGTPSLLRLVATGGGTGGDGGWGAPPPPPPPLPPPPPRHRGGSPAGGGGGDGAAAQAEDEGSRWGTGLPGTAEAGEAGWPAVGAASEVEGAGAFGSEEEFSPLPTGGGPGGAGSAVGHQGRRLPEPDGESSGGRGAQLPSLRWAFLVGEALRGEDVERLERLAPAALAVNLYGATETQRAVGWYAVTGRLAGSEVVPLGRGMRDVQLLVLTPADAQAGIGEVGEVCVRSPHLAAGYLGRPGETAAAFVPDPFGTEGGRLYRTGDLGRYRPDGVVQPLGRRDRQVKVRGVRVEPAEVEAVMAGHPAVEEAAVVAVGEASDARLVGYWTARDREVPDEASDEAPDGGDLRAGGLRQYLAARLPAAMVPADLVRLETMPRTPNGKLDRAALPEVEEAGGDGTASHAPPATPTEELLAGLWREVLGDGARTASLGREGDFFAVGGHSLALTRLLARVRAAFGVDLPVRRAFEVSTLAGQAAAIDALVRRGGPAVAPPRPRDRAADPPPASSAQRRLWFLDRLAPGSAAYTLSAALDLNGGLEPAMLAAALTILVRRHEALRTTLPAPDGEPVQRVAPAAAVDVALPRVDLAALPPAPRRREAGRLAAASARRRFDLARGPLFVARLLRLDDEAAAGEPVHRLLLAVHHAVADGWSLGVMARELGTLYTAVLEERAAGGRPGLPRFALDRFALARRAGLPELTVQYADWSLWQRRLLSGPELEGQVEWWRRELDGLPPALELPTDRPRGAREDHRGASVERPLPPELVAAMERLGRSHGVTRYMLLLAALSVVLSRWSGQLDLAVGSPESGRGPREVEPLVGLFLNLLVLRVDLTGEPTFADLLGRVRRRVLGAFAHRDVPFERLLEELAPARDPARPPLVEVLLNVLDLPPSAGPADSTAFAGLDARLAPSVEREARFPLSLYAWGGSGRGGEGEPPLVLRLVYQRALFDRERMEELLGQMVAVLADVVEEPARPVALVGGLTEVGRRVVADPAEGLAAPKVEGVVEAFGRVVGRWGERVAVVVGDGGGGNGGGAGGSADGGGENGGEAGGSRREPAGAERTPEGRRPPASESAQTSQHSEPAYRARFPSFPPGAPGPTTSPTHDLQTVPHPTASASGEQAVPHPTASASGEQAVSGPTASASGEQAVSGPTASASGEQAVPGPTASPTEGAEGRDRRSASPASGGGARGFTTSPTGSAKDARGPRASPAGGGEESSGPASSAVDGAPSPPLLMREGGGAGGTWTYRELDEASGQAANVLTGAGLQPGEVVAVGGPPSFGLVSSMLAVWKAGGVLLLLDPALPRARRGEMLSLAGAGVRLTPAGGEAEIQATPGSPGRASVRGLTFVEDSGAVELDDDQGGPLPKERRRFGADVAYVFFTSGTTGRPKGVVGSHRGLAHFLAWQRRRFEVGPGDRVAQLTALSFDVVLRDLLLPLTSGATLVLPADPELRLDPARVPPWLDAHGVTLVHAVPTLARAWLGATTGGDVELAALRWVFFAGEPLPAALVEAWRRAFPESPASRWHAETGEETGEADSGIANSGIANHGIANFYGPTETTLARCAFVVPEPPEPGVQPVGRALPDSQALVLAAGPKGSGGTAYRRCGPGEMGEIVLRTPLRSHGYLDGSPFFPNPFRPDPGRPDPGSSEPPAAEPADLLYATGDLGRFRLDGTLEILGRRDAQVKVRGVRLEPAEVEAALAAHPTVAAAAVVVEGSGAAAHLVAWVVPTAGVAELEPRRLRAHLARRLPAALVPSRYLPLDALPTGPTGKVDRGALPPVPADGELDAGDRTAPRDDTEAALAEIFREVLELPAVGVREGFFELGGHSLLAVPLLTRVESRFGRRLPLAALFTHPTVEELARLVRAAGAGAEAAGAVPSSSLVTLQEAAGSPRPPLFLVHPGGGGVLCYADLAGALGPDQPVYALQSAGLDGGEPPLTSIDAMAERYLADVTHVRPRGPYHLAGWSFGGRVVFEMARRLAAAGEEVGLVGLLDITPDPSPGPAHVREEDDAALMTRALAETFPVAAEELRGLDHRRQVDRLLAAARERAEAEGRPLPEIDPGRAEALLAVFKANLAAARAFRQRPYPGDVLLVRAADSDRFAAPVDGGGPGNAPGVDPGGDPTGGWAALAGSVRLVTAPGDHHSMVRPPHVARLAAVLRTTLDPPPGR